MMDAIEEFTRQMLEEFHKQCEKLGPPPPNYAYDIVDPKVEKRNDVYVFTYKIGLRNITPISFED